MKCNNCKVVVDQRFVFAIKSNQCPGCGGQLMKADKLASYISLQQLLKNNFEDMDVEKVANIVISNFELKQLFKENGSDNIETVTEEVSEEIAFDDEYKKQQMKEAKKVLREQTYEAALASQYGLGDDIDDNNIFGDSSSEVNVVEEVVKSTAEEIQSEKYNNMLSGSGGWGRS